ncbi:hypothetical protein [Streptosporangium sp. CA-115845]
MIIATRRRLGAWWDRQRELFADPFDIEWPPEDSAAAAVPVDRTEADRG